MLAESFGGTTLFWGGLWFILSIVVLIWSLRKILGTTTNITFTHRP